MFMDTRFKVFFIEVYKTLHYEDPLMDFINIWHNDRFRFKVSLSAIPTAGHDLEVKVDLEFSYKSQLFCI